MPASSFEKRLRLVEARIAPASPAADAAWNPFARLMLVLIAYHLGGLRPEESIMGGYSRALGYQRSGEIARLRTGNLTEITNRHEAAVTRLFASRGYDLDAPDDETFVAVMQGLIDVVPRERLTDNGIFIDAVDFLA
jgi:hypothetical protein